MASMVIADSDYTVNLMRENGVEHVVQLPPLDMSMGESDRERLLKVMFIVGGLSEEVIRLSLKRLFDVMEENKLVELNFADYAGFDQFGILNRLVQDELAKRETKYQY